MNTRSIDKFPYQYAATQRFSAGTPRSFKMSQGSSRVIFLRSRLEAPNSLCLWAADAGTGQEWLIADPATLAADTGEIPEAEIRRRERARESAGGIVTYSLSKDGNTACFPLAGDLFTSDITSGTAKRLDSPGPIFDPRLSPDGLKVAFISGRSLYVSELASGKYRLLAGSDDPNITWGRAEFIAGEEMSRHRGYWWSPDSGALLSTRCDNSPVQSWWIANPASPEDEATENLYPSAGTNNASVDLFLINLDNPAETKSIGWREHNFEYLVDVVWASSKPALVVRQTRDQTKLDIAKIRLDETGVESLYTIHNDQWVDIHPGTPAWSGDSLVTLEDRGTTNSLVVDGSEVPTPGWQIKSVLSVEDHKVLATAWVSPSEIRLISVDLASGTVNDLTDSGSVNTGQTNGTILLVSSSSLDWVGPRTTLSLVSQPGSKPLRIESLAETPSITAKPIMLALGPSELNSALLLPAWHDGVQKLPVLCDPYGGPHAQRVLNSQNAHLVSQWFANLGYGVLVTDGRGTPGRGPQWEKSVHNDLASPVLNDQIEALDHAAEQFPFLDLGRVGIRGWSFGGYLAVLAVLTRPDRFHCGLAGAPVTSWKLYDTHYTERYLGNPNQDQGPYQASSLLDLPGKWDHSLEFPPLMLIHGLADDNVVAAHTLQLSSALLAAGLFHQVLPLTGVTHMTPQAVVAENLLRFQARFLANALHPKVDQ